MNMYAKGEFNNILFAEFGTMLDRDTAVALIRSGNLQRADKTVWSTPDRQASDRAARKFVFGLKYLLKNDMQNPYAIRLSDQSPYEVHVGGQLALTVTVGDTSIEKRWEDTWEKWGGLAAASKASGTDENKRQYSTEGFSGDERRSQRSIQRRDVQIGVTAGTGTSHIYESSYRQCRSRAAKYYVH